MDWMALLQDERLWAALVGLVSLVAASRKDVGGGRFVVLTKILGAAQSAVKKGGPPAAVILLMVWASSPAQAADCNFSTGLDAKVVRVGWPASIGLNALDFLDLEVGYAGGLVVCGNVSANIVGGACLIPKLGDMMGPLCPKAATAATAEPATE